MDNSVLCVEDKKAFDRGLITFSQACWKSAQRYAKQGNVNKCEAAVLAAQEAEAHEAEEIGG